ncbi:AAA family ATPase [Avibacterium paragallinarum]|uniref:ATP-binding protein n=1 Tax=Avibacterium paragallinarum TaxID=728 RepID=A0ABU7QGU8_AVIPA|nr:ATP-binding protein [Avibacterium paragallinarum]QZP14583.1 ATP-binding protein [Avibacterium paragallinarum]WAL55788.1 ATP-binding protein [Avibacterium paragallinarum]WAM60026.1 ATP-binding protein [Avibacterium paragallinarum]
MSKYQLNPSTVSLYSEKIMLKAMFEYKLFSEFFSNNCYDDDDVAYALGLPQEMETDADLKQQARELLKQRYQTILAQKEEPKNWQTAYDNLTKLTEFLELTACEKAIMRFTFHLQAERGLLDLLAYLPKGDLDQAASILANLINHPKKEVRFALTKRSKLRSYGLIDARNYYSNHLHDYLRWGDALDFDDFVILPITEKSLIEQATIPTSPCTLKLRHYDHIAKNREMMLNYFEFAIKSKKKGVNMLLYGAAGTGKTEFAALLAETLNVPAYTMVSQDKDGDVLSGETRLENCRLAQKLLAGKKAIIIFDEVEDVFSGFLMSHSVAQEHKAWVNDFLENNAIPMIWISNSVTCIDNAYLRRFDMVFEMPMLPSKHKKQLITELVGEKLSTDYIQYFAQNADLSPAVLSRTLNLINVLPTENAADFADKALTMFNQMLASQGFKKIEPLVENKVAYNLDWVACRHNIHKISEGLMRSKRGRICCYGPPGTGKTAWAMWLAQEMGLKALICQGSDLLNSYVGGTEQNIVRVFQQAKENNMVLIFDEVDTFLFARKNGQRSWEHSKVNEMLTQIEKFEGLLIVSTNLMDNLDPAALRRFDLKLHFEYLVPEQRKDVAINQVAKLGLTSLNKQELARFQYLDNLTLGDFATIARRHHFSPFETSAEWLNALENELSLKPKVDINLEKWVL